MLSAIIHRYRFQGMVGLVVEGPPDGQGELVVQFGQARIGRGIGEDAVETAKDGQEQDPAAVEGKV